MHSLLFTNPDLKPFPPPGRFPAKLAILAALGTLFLACGALASPPNFVQSNFSTPTAPQSQVTVPFKSSQTVGNLNVVVVGWNDASAQVSSLIDSKGNVYQLAVGPTVLTDSPSLSQSIYYAKNISAATAGANTVTLTFTKAAAYPDVRIMEYSGIDPVTPVDVVVGATGNSVTSGSGAVITKNALDLLVGANIVWTVTGGPGSGFIQRMITSDGDIVEDRVVTAAGSYSASANLNSSGAWIMQMVAFRAAGSPAATPSPTPAPQPTPPPVALAYVQGNNATPQSPLASVTVPYTIAQRAGDLNVVIAGWSGSTSQVSSVSDSKGNVYQLAVGPTVLTGPSAITQSIYYAKNILPAAAGANAVTVNLNSAANYVDFRILEYCGVDQVSPFEVSAAATGSSATTSSGTVITKNATDLLVGANTVWTSTTGPGTGFTQRLLTNDGDIVQDRALTAAGSYTAAAPLSSAGPWIAQAATFRTASSAAPTPTPTPTGSPKATPTPTPTATPKTTPTPTPTPTPITTPTPVSTPTSTPTPTGSVSLSWSADFATTNPATNAVGYKLSTGFSSGSYTQVTDVKNTTSVTVPMQKSGSTYFFVVTAYNSAGVSGPSSNEVSAKAP